MNEEQFGLVTNQLLAKLHVQSLVLQALLREVPDAKRPEMAAWIGEETDRYLRESGQASSATKPAYQQLGELLEHLETPQGK